MTRDHTEWPDLERPGVPHVGYTDPHEQILSDDETEPVHVEPYRPVCQRYHRWRLFRDDFGYWQAEQPNHIDRPLFMVTYEGHHAPVTARSYGFRHESYERAMDALRIAVATAKAAL